MSSYLQFLEQLLLGNIPKNYKQKASISDGSNG